MRFAPLKSTKLSRSAIILLVMKIQDLYTKFHKLFISTSKPTNKPINKPISKPSISKSKNKAKSKSKEIVDIVEVLGARAIARVYE